MICIAYAVAVMSVCQFICLSQLVFYWNVNWAWGSITSCNFRNNNWLFRN